jgi:hypothetical protein
MPRAQDAVLSGLSAKIDESVGNMATLVEDRARNQARAVLDFLGRRPGEHTSSIVGNLHDSHFEGIRFKLLTKLKTEVDDIIRTYDRAAEGEKLQSAVQSSLVQSLVIEAGAVTTGGLVAAHLLDVTGGLLTAGSLAVFGALVLPMRRRAQQQHFRKQVALLQQQVNEVVKTRLERELHHVNDRILESVTPYSRFVKVEDEKTERMQANVQRFLENIKQLKFRILRK